jgi:hypothetical protein
MSRALPQRIESLFARYPALCGFCVRGIHDIPDSCSRSGDESELFVADVGISPAISAGQYREIYQELIGALSEMVSEQPEAWDKLRGRTFARVLH